MREIRLYLPAPLERGALVTLPEATARHVLGVLRLRTGARLVAFDGDGAEFDATLESTSRKSASARLGEPRRAVDESPLAITLALGISRGSRMDYALQKATELGVSGLAPLITARSVVRLDAKRAVDRAAHWQQVVASACEQCGRATLPRVAAPRTLESWLADGADSPHGGNAAANANAAARKLLLDPVGEVRLGDLEPARSVTLLVGPEGGLDAPERAAARRAGFAGLRLGPRVLRTETAAVVAVTALQLSWGDLR